MSLQTWLVAGALLTPHVPESGTFWCICCNRTFPSLCLIFYVSTDPFGFCTLPVFHIHEVPFQHFGKELAKETLLAFHGEPALKSRVKSIFK